MRRPALLLATVVGAACATAPPRPEKDLDESDAKPASGGPVAEPVDTSKPADHDALSAAFDPEAPPPAEPLEHNVPAASPEAEGDPARQRFAQEFASARTVFAGSDRDAFQEAVKTLTPLAEAAGPEARQQLFEGEARFRHGVKDDGGAARAAERWLKSCGPTHVDACRRRALASLTASKAKERAARVKEKDACLERAEATPSSKPTCLGGARAFYEREGDALMVQRALLAQAAAAPDESKGWATAEAACKQPRCAEQRRRALKAMAAAQLTAGDPQEAARAALSEMKLGAEALAPSQRPYARTSLVEKTCVALDSQEGPGACRKLERSHLGRYYFRDFSLSTERGTGLPPESVKSVNEHFGVALQECLAAEADRIPAPSAERYKVRWIVLNDGRVDQVHLDKKDRDGGPLAQCLREQFAVWRYPRYHGEWQHVEQEFIVTAHERRTYSLVAPP
jgi:hypothetical protein